MTATKPYGRNDIVIIDLSKQITMAPFRAKIINIVCEPFMSTLLIDYQNLEFENIYDEFGTCIAEHVVEVLESNNYEIRGNARTS